MAFESMFGSSITYTNTHSNRNFDTSIYTNKKASVH